MKDLYRAEAELSKAERDLAEHEKKSQAVVAMHEARAVVLAKAKAQAIEKLEQAKIKKAEIKARLIRQIGEQSADELAEHLIKQGVTCVGRVDARDILNDAREMFESSYWTSGTEINWVGTDFASPEDAKAYGEQKVADEEFDKFFVLEQPNNPGNFGVFTSLCAVGGIGVIASMKAKEVGKTQHQVAFGTMFDNDWSTRVATTALAETIRTFKVEGLADAGYEDQIDYNRDTQDIIINYNDNLASKEDVIERFREAASHPILDATELWTVYANGSRSPIMFASKEDTITAIEKAKGEHEDPTSKLIRGWASHNGRDLEELEPYLHTSLEIYEKNEQEQLKAESYFTAF